MSSQQRHLRSESRAEALSTRELVVVLGLLVMMLIAAASPTWPNTRATRNLTSIRVSEGDTLWEIAQELDIAGMSTAQTVAEIRRLNSLEDAALTTGMVVKVPADGRFESAVAMR